MYFVHTLTHGKSAKSIIAFSQMCSVFLQTSPEGKPHSCNIMDKDARVTRDAKIVGSRAVELV